jgi:hypothetical protein
MLLVFRITTFHHLVKTRICPKCGGLMRLYVTYSGVQLLACMSCRFEKIDGESEELALSKVRQMAARDRLEQAECKMSDLG